MMLLCYGKDLHNYSWLSTHSGAVPHDVEVMLHVSVAVLQCSQHAIGVDLQEGIVNEVQSACFHDINLCDKLSLDNADGFLWW